MAHRRARTPTRRARKPRATSRAPSCPTCRRNSPVSIAHRYLPATEVGGDLRRNRSKTAGSPSRWATRRLRRLERVRVDGEIRPRRASHLQPPPSKPSSPPSTEWSTRPPERLLATPRVIDPQNARCSTPAPATSIPTASRAPARSSLRSQLLSLGVREPMPVVARLARFDQGVPSSPYSDGTIEARREGSEEDSDSTAWKEPGRTRRQEPRAATRWDLAGRRCVHCGSVRMT